MKKTIAFLLILSSFLWIVGCSSKTEFPEKTENQQAQNSTGQEEKQTEDNPYQALISSYSDSVALSGLPLQTEITYHRMPYTEEALQGQEKEVVFGGITYKASYRESFFFRYEQGPRHLYDGTDYSFALDNDGNLVHFLNDSPYLGKENVEYHYSQEYCLALAKTFFSENFGNIENYTVIIEDLNETHTIYVNRYEIRFTSSVDSWETDEEIVIWVCPMEGTLIGYRTCMLGQFPSDAQIDMEREQVRAAVEARLDELCEKAEGISDRFEYEEFSYTLIKTSEDEYAILCEVIVQRVLQNGEHETTQSGSIKFIVTK